MTIEQLKTRCKEEFKAKEHRKWIASMVFIVLALVHLAILIISCIVTLAQGYIPVPTSGIIFNLILWGISGTITHKRDKAINKYKKSGEYQNLPVNHPYSLLYPGETYPFNQSAAAQVAPVAPAPVSVAPAQPEQVTITCGQCGQPMLIPSNSGTVKITCPKCGNSFIHTN